MVKENVGGDEPIQIVCGAPNIAAGIKVPVATIGAVLPGDFKIKKSKLRGVTSMGMCCSKRELGMGTDHEGIWVLPEDAQIGQPIVDFMGLTDTVLDLEITPNRPDSLSVVGFAREVADRVVFMDGGAIIENKPAREFFRNPEHPRTQAFLQHML